MGLLTFALGYDAAPLATVRAGGKRLANHFVTTFTAIFRQGSNSEMVNGCQ